MIVDHEVLQPSVPPGCERQVNCIEHQQPDLPVGKVEVEAVAGTGSGNRPCRQPVRVNQTLPCHAGERIASVRRVVTAEVGVVVVVADCEECRKPGAAHCPGAEGDLAAGLRERPVAVAEVARVKEKPGAACATRCRKAADVRESVCSVFTQILLLFEMRIGDHSEEQSAAPGICLHSAAEIGDGFGIHSITLFQRYGFYGEIQLRPWPVSGVSRTVKEEQLSAQIPEGESRAPGQFPPHPQTVGTGFVVPG